MRAFGRICREMRAGCRIYREMRAAGFSVAGMRDVGYTAKEMRECGVTVRELREVCVSDSECTFKQMADELEGHLGESIIMMMPSGIVLGLENDQKHLDKILEMFESPSEDLL